jgi:hypothetical protein
MFPSASISRTSVAQVRFTPPKTLADRPIYVRLGVPPPVTAGIQTAELSRPPQG